MKTDVEKLEDKNTVLLKVEVPEDMFDKAIDQAYRDISSKLSIPGFRKGKIPKSIVEQRVGLEAIQEEALQKSLPYYYVSAVKDSDLDPVDQPEVEIVQMEEGKPLIFTAKIKVKPEVKLGTYKGVEIEKPTEQPTEDEINAQLDNLRNNFATLEPVEDRAVQNDDFALIDFEGFLGDHAFEGGTANDYLLEIGSGTFIPGYEEQIIGMKKGETKDVIVTFPEDYGSAELAGQDVVFKVAVKEIKEKKLPDVDDEFAKQVGFDNIDELIGDVKEKIQEVKKKYVESKMKGELVDRITDASETELHDVMVEHELDDMLEELAHDARQQGIDLGQYVEMTGTSIEQMRDEWKERADKRVRNRLAIEAIAQTENIEVTAEEVNAEIQRAADSMKRDFSEVKAIFDQRGTTEALKERMVIEKTIDWLLDNASIIESPDSKEKEEDLGTD